MRKVTLFGIAIIMILAALGAWVSLSHSAAKAASAPPQIDPFSLMAHAKNLPSQESLNLKMWPDNGIVRY
jgi:Spy/CpxP family protein refolding chaperone